MSSIDYRAWRSRLNNRRYDRLEAEAASMPETFTIDVPSQTDPKLTYRVHAQNGVVTCSCRGWNTHHKCKHQDAVKRLLEEAPR